MEGAFKRVKRIKVSLSLDCIQLVLERIKCPKTAFNVINLCKSTRNRFNKNPSRVWKRWRQWTYDKKLKYCAKIGDLSLTKFYIARGGDERRKGLYGSAIGGHMNIVKYLMTILNSDLFSYGLVGAARGGHMKLVKYFIEKKNAIEFVGGLYGAAWGGHMKLVKYFIEEKGVTDFKAGFNGAARGGHMNLVKYFIEEKGVSKFSGGLYLAARGGHMNLVKYFIEEKGVSKFDSALKIADNKGQKKIQEYLKKIIHLHKIQRYPNK